MPLDFLLAQRALGVSAGDYVDLLRREIDAVLNQAGVNRSQAIKVALRRMRAGDLITDRELKRLQRMSAAVLLAERGTRQARTAGAALERIYQETLMDGEASPMGSTLVGVSYRTTNKQVISAAGLAGMLVGGLLTGNPWGAIVGGLVGSWLRARCGED